MRLPSILILAILALGFFESIASPLIAQEEEKEQPRPSLDEYLQTLKDFRPRELDASGMVITATVIPDLYLFGLAKALDTAKKNGWSSSKITEHMNSEHKKLKRDKNRVRVRVEISASGRKDHLFLQKKLKSHVKVKGDGKVVGASDGDPKPRFDKWQIIQGASMKDYTLARFDTIAFEITIQKKSDEMCTLQLVDFLHYVEAPKKSEYETKGINVGARQISLGTIRDMVVDPIAIELAPATWKLPPLPEELEGWKKKLESD